MKKRTAYPVFIKEHEGNYLVFVPDLKIYTDGDGLADAMDMARDAIGLKYASASDNGEALPPASDYSSAIEKAEKDADDNFDYSDGVLTYVDIDCEAYKKRLRNRAVRKICTIPAWLNDEAEKNGINFSRVLQDALINEIEEARRA